MNQYIAIIHKDAESDYGVSFPDLPGCITAGSTLEEARAMAQEALELHLRGLMEDGEDIPAPSTLDQIVASGATADGLAVITLAVPIAPKTVRVNISLPEVLLAEIDRHAEAEGYTRSGFIAQAAKRAMEKA
ncbi:MULTISPECIES: type II toxin-antitoxin system HicB family antitoxin [unclassified Beijerinckia]|uniref:type II toxin-antitoxin system HicB family antitoxin n=1 Tax=unclassified Beijerinckia TaxID=2638183 RepID=UPI00089B9354|nr:MULTISPECIES: type II toxin-antitoxin system HicB family antitoxin [unclassified Beijerinckia]MDH7798291.1 putative RNase H-like HicB family nuclease [Beijerinckia sp. GAS462]SED15901.1 Predicted nuclease of the RNAse H fold, HicB family [Beijerinckia sp. 28-YEA-48]